MKGNYNTKFFQLLLLAFLFVFLSYGQYGLAEQGGNTSVDVNSHLSLSHDDSVKSLNNFRNKINEVLNDKNLKGASYGIAIYSQSMQNFIYQKNVEKLLTPASNTKLFTTFAAMSFLGPNFQIRTSVYCLPSALKGGQINGDIYMYGRGDINLRISDVETLAEKIRNLGVKTINGNIVADATFFDRDFQRSSYSGDNEVVEPTNPVYALSIGGNILNVLVKAGSKTGVKPNVQVIPNSHSIEIVNNALVGHVVTKVKKGKGKGKGKTAVSSPTISSAISTEGDKTIIKISGYILPNQTKYFNYQDKTPELTAAGVLKERLEMMGVKVNGNVSVGKCQELHSGKAREIAYCVNPMYDILTQVNKKSNNYLAEMVFKVIGGQYGKHPSTANNAREKIMQVIDSNYIPRKGFMLNDGCGLSRRNLVTVDGLAKLLIQNRKKKWGKEFDATLSIAGVDGTLRKRMIGTFAEGNLKAKTGTLRNVSSLAGYVGTRSEDEFIFAFIFNGPSVGHYKQIENKLGEIMANFNFYKY